MNVLDQLYEKAKLNPQKVAFPEATNEKMMQAAFETGKDGYIVPILVGDAAEIKQLVAERGYDESVFTIVDINEESYKSELIAKYVALPDTRLKEKALNRRMADPLYYAMVMQAVDEADVTFAEGTRGFSVGVRAQEADDEFYSFTFECPKDRVIFEKSPNWPWPQMNNMGLERLIRLVPGKKYHVQIIVDDTIATLYVDGVALNTRMYTNPGEGICLGVTDGSAVFENQSIAYL